MDRSIGDPGSICVPVFDECYFGTQPVCHFLATCTVNEVPRKYMFLFFGDIILLHVS